MRRLILLKPVCGGWIRKTEGCATWQKHTRFNEAEECRSAKVDQRIEPELLPRQGGSRGRKADPHSSSSSKQARTRERRHLRYEKIEALEPSTCGLDNEKPAYSRRWPPIHQHELLVKLMRRQRTAGRQANR